MKFRVLAIGKPKLGFAAEGIDDYRRRLARRGDFRIDFLKPARDDSARLLERSAGTFRIALDERGSHFRTPELATALGDLARRGDVKAVSFLVGGADGHTEDLRATADLVWALSPLTLQHELALLVLLEQLYRVDTIRRGEPYHR